MSVLAGVQSLLAGERKRCWSGCREGRLLGIQEVKKTKLIQARVPQRKGVAGVENRIQQLKLITRKPRQ